MEFLDLPKTLLCPTAFFNKRLQEGKSNKISRCHATIITSLKPALHHDGAGHYDEQ